MPRKLTDEEISRVLGQADIVKLKHWPWGSRDDDPEYKGCGCVAGAVYALGQNYPDGTDRDAVEISFAVSPYQRNDKYRAKTPDGILHMLEKAGLA